jgi:predicted phosphodiesterase
MKIGFIADIHEDLPSLKKAFKLLEKKGCEELICMGDICGYSFPYYHYQKDRDASTCLELVRKKCQIIIPGNHDLHAARKTPLSNPGFDYPDDWYEMDFEVRKKLAKGKIWLYEDTELESNFSEADKDFIRGLPEFIF